MTALPSAERQLEFLFRIQRLLTEGSFEATYKYALLLSLAELAVERGNDDTTTLVLDTRDMAEKFIELYWRQVLPWMGPSGQGTRLGQRFGREDPAILGRISRAHDRTGGSLTRFRAMRKEWGALITEVAATIERYPLWRLQTIGGVREDFLYPNVGKGRIIRMHGEAVYCMRLFYTLIADLVQTAWVRFIQRVPRNNIAFGQVRDLRDFLFGADRSGLARFARVLTDFQNGRCFYCDGPMKDVYVDHFVAWSRYPLDLGHNFVGADGKCNSAKCDRLPALNHLERWVERNQNDGLVQAFDDAGLAHDRAVTTQVAAWAYEAAHRADAQLWIKGRDGWSHCRRTGVNGWAGDPSDRLTFPHIFLDPPCDACHFRWVTCPDVPQAFKTLPLEA